MSLSKLALAASCVDSWLTVTCKIQLFRRLPQAHFRWTSKCSVFTVVSRLSHGICSTSDVLGIVSDLGNVLNSSGVTLDHVSVWTIGVIRDPSVSYNGVGLSNYYTKNFTTANEIVNIFFV